MMDDGWVGASDTSDTHARTMSTVTRMSTMMIRASAAKPPRAQHRQSAVAAKSGAASRTGAIATIPTRLANACTKPATLAVIANIIAAAPAHAEAGKLFDFNLTLPLIATEFLILMTILDKTMFGPVGKALDDRDELIRSQLAAVGDNSAEVENLIVRECDACVRCDARASSSSSRVIVVA